MLPALNKAQRQWLSDALDIAYGPGHPWGGRLLAPRCGAQQDQECEIAGQAPRNDIMQAAGRMLPQLLTACGIGSEVRREEVRVWARSGVERLHLADGRTLVFKYAAAPFDREHLVLRQAAEYGVPVPAMIGAHTEPGWLGMLLEDLGEPIREPDGHDAAEAAVKVHGVLRPRGLPILGRAALTLLPARLADRCR